VERVLAPLCDRGDAVACSERELILVRLGRRDEALKMYRARCRSDWSQCFDAGVLELEARHLEEALKLFTKVCDEVRDGDGGGSCTCAGRILERRSRRAEAHAFYTRGCENGDNEACASANRLSGRKVRRGAWEGLYRSQQGTLWIKDSLSGTPAASASPGGAASGVGSRKHS